MGREAKHRTSRCFADMVFLWARVKGYGLSSIGAGNRRGKSKTGRSTPGAYRSETDGFDGNGLDTEDF